MGENNELEYVKKLKQKCNKIQYMHQHNLLPRHPQFQYCACWPPTGQLPASVQDPKGTTQPVAFYQPLVPNLLVSFYVIPATYEQYECFKQIFQNNFKSFSNQQYQNREPTVLEYHGTALNTRQEMYLTEEIDRNDQSEIQQSSTSIRCQKQILNILGQEPILEYQKDSVTDYLRKSTEGEVEAKFESEPLSHFKKLDDSPKLNSKKKNSNENGCLLQGNLLNHGQTTQTIPTNTESFVKCHELVTFKTLYAFFVKFFKSESISIEDLQTLSKREIIIVDLMMQRKYEGKLLSVDLKTDDLHDILNKLLNFQQRLSVKRSEESYKFIFTRAIKFLKKVFKTKNGLPKTLTDVDSLFYSYYFGSTVASLGMEIKNFVYPPVKNNKNGLYRCLNLKYFHHVFQSRKFMSDVSEYLKTDLRNEYDIEIERKTFQLLAKWDRRFTNDSNDDHGQNKKVMSEIVFYFLRNKRCKLPWTLVEVNNAISRLQILFNKLVNADEICQAP